MRIWVEKSKLYKSKNFMPEDINNMQTDRLCLRNPKGTVIYSIAPVSPSVPDVTFELFIFCLSDTGSPKVQRSGKVAEL